LIAGLADVIIEIKRISALFPLGTVRSLARRSHEKARATKGNDEGGAQAKPQNEFPNLGLEADKKELAYLKSC
jgi:hypothetical protein